MLYTLKLYYTDSISYKKNLIMDKQLMDLASMKP